MTESDRTDSINYYKDPREDDPELIKYVTTDKICSHFLDAIERSQYGYRWECPNKGNMCQYKHSLPEGYVLEQKGPANPLERDDEDGEQRIEDWIEEERAKLPSEGLTPVTLETFMEWKKKKAAEKEKEIEDKRKAEVKKKGGRGLNVLSGRALFKFDPTLFKDDEGAADADEYEEEEEKEEAANESAAAEKKKAKEEAQKQLESAKEWGAKEDVAVD